jgi:hypothetical protein
LLELMIGLAIVMLVLAAASTFFIGTVRQYKIQTKIVETNVEGVLGLELLRQDLESLGFGLPWENVTVGQDAATAPLNTVTGGDFPAVVSLDNDAIHAFTGSDYLVIRSTRVGMDNAAGKWTTLQAGGGTRDWGSFEENLADTDRVIVVTPTLNHRTLVSPSTGVLFANVATYAPADNLSVTNIVYGVNNAALSFPFNRADYYLDNTNVPQRCAPNTGVLVKSVVRHDNGLLMAPLPLLDCAADMQVIYGLDTNGDRQVDTWESDISGSTAAQIRAQLLEVRVHILAQEGQRDDTYVHPVNPILVGSPDLPSILGRNCSITSYEHYRWKVYSIVVKPRNLGN